MAQVSISQQFNGPPNSGNGGYSCGLLAAFTQGASRVRLHAPPPLDKPLQVRERSSGGVEMLDGETLIGTAVAAELTIVIPQPPSLERAAEASKRFPCYEEHSYPTCFVCGPQREPHDGLCLFPGPVDSWDLLACRWQPDDSLLDADGNVLPEFVWSALDCPGYFAAVGQAIVPTLLGELHADLIKPVPGQDPLVVYSWPLGGEGRKRYAAVAIATGAGEVLACSRTTWITLA
ncbi:MAG: hypothetical protein V7746_22875 [Halioglobus sp.]